MKASEWINSAELMHAVGVVSVPPAGADYFLAAGRTPRSSFGWMSEMGFLDLGLLWSIGVDVRHDFELGTRATKPIYVGCRAGRSISAQSSRASAGATLSGLFLRALPTSFSWGEPSTDYAITWLGPEMWWAIFCFVPTQDESGAVYTEAEYKSRVVTLFNCTFGPANQALP